MNRAQDDAGKILLGLTKAAYRVPEMAQAAGGNRFLAELTRAKRANPWSRWGGGNSGLCCGFLLGKYRNIVIFVVGFLLGDIS